jgi:hypothetical protein
MYAVVHAIRQAIRDLKTAEIKSFRIGLHRYWGRNDAEAISIRDTCYDRRAARLVELDDLVRSALGPGIDAGFGGEYVAGCLVALMDDAEAAAEWDGSYEGPRDDDCAALCHLNDLFGKVFAGLGPLTTMAEAAWQRQELAERTQPGGGPEAATEWTRPMSPGELARILGRSTATIVRRLKDGSIRNEMVHSKAYRIAIDDLPLAEQAKHRPPRK